VNARVWQPWGASESKITSRHRDRMAVVYVRQSSRQQVLEHRESTRLQYALVERAAGLGWARSRIVVIDADLGRSAAVAGTRPGFARLVTEVTMGRVGIVVGIEMSRLARTGRDWHQLLELCSLSGALLADPDGVYDPGYYNDRLLLGLKGTMSEAELYLIKQRMASGRLAKAQRGELALPLPIGYARRSDGQVIIDPDEQAQHVVRLIFDMFTRLGTLNAVLRYLAEHDVRLPVRSRGGLDKGELQWRRASRETLQLMLHNPIYAGYYAYGRTRIDPTRQIPARPSTGRIVASPDEWLVALPGRMPAYLSVERYEANLARLAANRNTAATPGAVHNGTALLAGLLRCGRCGGHRVNVQYHAWGPAYVCSYEKTNYGTGTTCQHISAPALDRYLTEQVLAAITPAALQVSLHAAAQAEADRAQLDLLWRQRCERARYDVERARRQYQLAEPENRLVVRQLERDWETALADADRLDRDYQRFRDTHPVTLSTADRDAITALANDLPTLWAAETTTDADRKELLRTLIEKITVAVVGDSEQVDVTIVWAGGHETTSQAVRPVARLEQLSYYPRLIQRIRELAAAGHTARQIADALNADGLRPPKRTSRFGVEQVRTILHQRGIRTQHHNTTVTVLAEHEWSVTGLAAALHMPTATAYTWIYRGWVTAHRASDDKHWIITADPTELDRLRQLRNRPPGYHQHRRWNPLNQPELSQGDQE
jgi:DNA invertase Pin-like site-specific DNA recombinase